MLWSMLILAAALAGKVPDDTASHRAQDPHYFDPGTGYRFARHWARVPSDIPGSAFRVDSESARVLLEEGALAIDVSATQSGVSDPLTGAWLTEPRESLPRAIWLPEVGWAHLEPERERFLIASLARLAPDPDRTILVFCIADCWLSWNAAQRIAALGYRRVAWFADGVDGWREAGWPLIPVMPEPLPPE